MDRREFGSLEEVLAKPTPKKGQWTKPLKCLTIVSSKPGETFLLLAEEFTAEYRRQAYIMEWQ